ncbi:hypothetical protein [Nocardia sp. NPDC050435]|uniref:hypothetical protein n=1 Tax=Nocardia sp. NPDC050435 TaxID=3155040 RepID=UPI0033EFEA5A
MTLTEMEMEERPEPRPRRGPKPSPDLERDPMDVPGQPVAETVKASAAISDLPEPYERPADAGELTTRERDHLETCEAVLNVLRVAFWRAGKALRVISSARLYRETHATFEDYVGDRWQMDRTHAYRLMDAAEIAEPLILSPMGDKINERQTRELLPIAKGHNAQAAAQLYTSLAQEVAAANQQGVKVKVTADLVRRTATAAIKALPPGGDWDHDTVIHTVRVVLGLLPGEPVEGQSLGESPSWFQAEGSKVASSADKVAQRAHAHPEEAKAFAAALVQHARRIEKALPKSSKS